MKKVRQTKEVEFLVNTAGLEIGSRKRLPISLALNLITRNIAIEVEQEAMPEAKRGRKKKE